ncbi:MAG: hypothetical protein FWC94_07180 [Bacteroidales bacterium]|nr:hypothetical protein [Bacteroidales bacterium]
MENKLEIHKSALYYGQVVHYSTITSCLIALFSPIFIMLFPESNIMNPNVVFNIIFNGGTPEEILQASVEPAFFTQIFADGNLQFWKMMSLKPFAPDGIALWGIILGCSITMWALIPAIWIYVKERQWKFVCICGFVFLLVLFAMSGLLQRI